MKIRHILAAPFLLALAGNAQISEPSIGCFVDHGGAFLIQGIAGSFVVRPAEACQAIDNRWAITGTQAAPWLERTDAASGAVEEHRKLDPGSWAVFPDGTLANLGELDLPGDVIEWHPVAHNWLLLRFESHWALLGANQHWYYLPAVAPDSVPGAGQ